MGERVYPTKSLDCWDKAKELRNKYLTDYMEAKDKGGLRYTGGALAFGAITAGLGDDVHRLAVEPYAATVATSGPLGVECLEATEKAGFARDMCSYTRNYWGSIILDKYPLGGQFPRPDFRWLSHICCTHAKCETVAGYLEGNDIPCYAIDIGLGHYSPDSAYKVRYLVDQMHDGIEWLENVTGRKLDDGMLIEAVLNEYRNASLWGEICTLNKNIPAPLDEKTMYTLQGLNTFIREKQSLFDFYKELRDEVEERVAKGIAAVPVEKCRLITTNQPPWGLLKLFRYIEQYGAVSIGSLYTFGLTVPWETAEDGTLTPMKSPDEIGLHIENREKALEVLAELNMKIPTFYLFHDLEMNNRMNVKFVRDWHVDGVLMHLNRGCEAGCMGILETRREMIEAGIPVMPYEGSAGDERELDEARILNRVDIFLESLGLKKLGKNRQTF
jgi:benzoyl-CoA reductase subunit B